MLGNNASNWILATSFKVPGHWETLGEEGEPLHTWHTCKFREGSSTTDYNQQLKKTIKELKSYSKGEYHKFTLERPLRYLSKSGLQLIIWLCRTMKGAAMMALFAHFVYHCHPYLIFKKSIYYLFVPFFLWIQSTFPVYLLLHRLLAYDYVISLACNKMAAFRVPRNNAQHIISISLKSK